MAWVLTKQLQAWRDQINHFFPNRDKTSDGTIGDTAHQAESSGHNPDLTANAEYEDGDSKDEVRAMDTDADTGDPNVSMEDVVQHLLRLARAGKLTFIRYIIFNRRIWSASNGWAQQTYTGSNPHDKHMHMSGAYNQASDELSSANYHLEDLVALTDDDKQWIKDNVGPRAVWGYDPGWSNPNDHSEGVWPGVSEASYGTVTNGTVAPGTALGTLLGRQKSIGDTDQSAHASIISAVQAVNAVDIPTLAAAIAAALPPITGDSITVADVETAVRNVLHSA
jgi:hypothetical protein